MEPSGPVQACNGIALPLPFTFYRCVVDYLMTLLHTAHIIWQTGKG